MRKTLVLAATLAVVLSGCVSAPAPGPSPSAADSSATPSVSPSNSAALSLACSFVSQGAAPQGTVTITELSDAEFKVALSDFSTGAGDDLPGFPLETIRSFTVYDYAGRTAFGSAALE